MLLVQDRGLGNLERLGAPWVGKQRSSKKAHDPSRHRVRMSTCMISQEALRDPVVAQSSVVFSENQMEDSYINIKPALFGPCNEQKQAGCRSWKELYLDRNLPYGSLWPFLLQLSKLCLKSVKLTDWCWLHIIQILSYVYYCLLLLIINIAYVWKYYTKRGLKVCGVSPTNFWMSPDIQPYFSFFIQGLQTRQPL